MPKPSTATRSSLSQFVPSARKKETKQTMRNYKGTDRFMRCKYFQFELGKRYSVEGELRMCVNGFHSCDTLSQVTNYYTPADSRYFEVEVEDTIFGSKNCSRHITFIRELTFNEVMRLINFKEDGSLLHISDPQTNEGFNNCGNNNHGNNNCGNNNHGNYNCGNDNCGNYNHGNDNRGNDNCGNDNCGNYRHEKTITT